MTNTHHHSQKIKLLDGTSGSQLRTLERIPMFDAVYIDGSHKSWHVLEDAVLSFPLLKVGGVMLFDDYQGGDILSLEYPHQAINVFLKIHSDSIEVVHRDYQLAIRKINFATS